MKREYKFAMDEGMVTVDVFSGTVYLDDKVIAKLDAEENTLLSDIVEEALSELLVDGLEEIGGNT